MSINPYYELINSVRNVMNSHHSSKEISTYSGLSYTAICELRNKKRSLENASLRTLNKLYLFSINHNLDNAFLSHENKKGTHKFINTSLPIKKVLVSFEELDLFTYGYMNFSNKNFHKMKEVIQIQPSQNLFISSDNSFFEPSDFGHHFQCRYVGTGPDNFLTFLKTYSKLSPEELKEIISNSSVVEYDFESDSIKGLPSRIHGRPISFYTIGKRLILTFNQSDLFIHSNKEEAFIVLIEEIDSFLKILTHTYDFNGDLKCVHHVPTYQAAKNSKFNLSPGKLPNTLFQTILEFEDFEFWLPVSYSTNRSDTFSNPFFRDLLAHFGYKYTPSLFNSFKDTYKIRSLDVKSLASLNNV